MKNTALKTSSMPMKQDFFYKALPNKSLVNKYENSKGEKYSKNRISFIMCECKRRKITPLIINKSLNPHCFKKLKISTLSIIWRANKKAWMNTEI